jgi:hypothetical protein
LAWTAPEGQSLPLPRTLGRVKSFKPARKTQMNNFNGQVPTVNFGVGGVGVASPLPTANDIALVLAQNAAAKTLYGLIASLQLFDSLGRFDANRVAVVQVALLKIQPLFTQADCVAAGVKFNDAWQYQINWQAALTQAQAMIASGF